MSSADDLFGMARSNRARLRQRTLQLSTLRRRWWLTARRAGMRSPAIQLLPNLAASFLDGDRLLNGFFVAGMYLRELFHLQDMHAEVANVAETKSRKSRNCFANLTENLIDRVKRIAATDGLKQVAQNFPIVACVARWP